jgi:hypothetical protein
MSANEKKPGPGKRPRAKSTGSFRLDDLIALKDVKGGRGSVVFGERSETEPTPGATSTPKPVRKRGATWRWSIFKRPALEHPQQQNNR